MIGGERLRLRYVLAPREETHRVDLPVLSVYRDHGVVLKDSRADNYNKTPENLSRYQRVAVGDLVVNKMKAWSGSVAVSRYEGIVSPDYLVCRVSDRVFPNYLHHLLRSASLVAEMHSRSKGIRPSQERLYWDDLADMDVMIPRLSDQRRIADFLDDQVALLGPVIDRRVQQQSLIFERRVAMARTATTVGLSNGPRVPTGIEWMPEIAAGWELRKISRSFRTGSGTTPKADHPGYFGGDYPWINTGDLRDGVVDNANRCVTDAALADYSSLKFYEPGTLLVAMYGATIGRLGRLAIRACLNQACCAIYEPTDVSIDYLYYWFLGHRIEIVELGTGGGQPNISQAVIASLRIPSPSKDIQAEIVNTLEREHRGADHLLGFFARQADLYRERKQSIITAAVTGQFDVTTARRVA